MAYNSNYVDDDQNFHHSTAGSLRRNNAVPNMNGNYVDHISEPSPLYDGRFPVDNSDGGRQKPPPVNPALTIADPTLLEAATHDQDDISNASAMDESALSGTFMSLMTMIKALVGTGIFAMPYAFKNSGLTLGLIAVAVIGITATHCMHLIVQTARYFSRKLGGTRTKFSYPTVARLAFQASPLNKWTRSVVNLTTVFLCINELWSCSIFIVFVGRTLDDVLSGFANVPKFDIRLLELMWALPILALALLRQLNRLAFLNMAANIIIIGSLVAIYQEQIRHHQPMSSLPQFADITHWPRFFSMVVFSFDGATCVLPIENKMRNPEKFDRPFGTLNVAMLVVSIGFAATGFLGFWGYGNAIADSVTFSLPHYPFYLVVKLAMALSVYLTYGIRMYVPVKILMPIIHRRWPTMTLHRRNQVEYVLRVTFMLTTLGMALFIPHLAVFIELVGAFCSAYLGLIFPPVIDIVRRYSMVAGEEGYEWRYGRYNWRNVKNFVIIVFGTVGFAVGTYVAVSDIVETLRGGSV